MIFSSQTDSPRDFCDFYEPTTLRALHRMCICDAPPNVIIIQYMYQQNYVGFSKKPVIYDVYSEFMSVSHGNRLVVA